MGGLHDMGRTIGMDEKEGEHAGKVIMMLRFDVIIVVVLNYQTMPNNQNMHHHQQSAAYFIQLNLGTFELILPQC